MLGIIGFVLTVGIIVVIHEWGHYIVARMAGVKILAFSFGFGKVLLKRTDKRGCEWRLSMWPLGGYVKMLDTAEKEDLLKEGKTFSEASKIVEREGATEIYAVSSHGLFVKGAVELLDQAPIKEILVTDSVAPNGPTPKNINYLTASELIAEAIVRIQERKPVSPLFAYHKK